MFEVSSKRKRKTFFYA